MREYKCFKVFIEELGSEEINMFNELSNYDYSKLIDKENMDNSIVDDMLRHYVDVMLNQLLDWYKDDLSRLHCMSDAMQEYGIPQEGSQILQMGQILYYRNITYRLIEKFQDYIKENFMISNPDNVDFDNFEYSEELGKWMQV